MTAKFIIARSAATKQSRRRSSRWLAPEIGAALFEEGLGAFLGLVGIVVQRQRFEAEGADAADVLAVGVERALGSRSRSATARGSRGTKPRPRHRGRRPARPC